MLSGLNITCAIMLQLKSINRKGYESDVVNLN